jgi:hypothetical protein
MRASTLAWTAATLAGVFVACGGSTMTSSNAPDADPSGGHPDATGPAKGHDGGAGHDGASSDDGGDRKGPDAGLDASHVPPPADGPFACGASTCSATQFCMVPCVDIVFPSPVCAPTGTTCPSPSTPGDAGCDGGTLCDYPSNPQPSCVDSPPCSPNPGLCDVDGRTYTELGCA